MSSPVPGGVALAGASSVSIQLGAALASPLLERVAPASLSWVRLMIAALVFLAWSPPALRGRTRRELLTGVALGLATAGATLAFFEAIARIPLGIAVTIEFLGPLSVAVACSRRRADYAWIACAGLGVGLLAGGAAAGLDPAGVAFAALAGTCWGAYVVLTKSVGSVFPGAQGLAVSMTVAALVAAPFGAASAGAAVGDPGLLLAAAGLALLVPIAPYWCELQALRRLPTTVFGVLMCAEPALGALAGATLLGQGLSLTQGGGLLLVVLAGVGVTLGASRATGAGARAGQRGGARTARQVRPPSSERLTVPSASAA